MNFNPPSPLGGRPAPPGSPDEGVAWHYGDPHREQRELAAGRGAVDLSHREVLHISGPARGQWLHDLTTAYLLDWPAGASRLALILDPHGHVVHELHLVEDGEGAWCSTEPGTGAALLAYLESMRFMLRVEPVARPDMAVIWEPLVVPDPTAPTYLLPGEFAGTGITPAGQDDRGGAGKYIAHRPALFPGREVIVPRAEVPARLRAAGPAGTWALEALRIAAAVPRLNHETDHRTLPHEVGWIGPAVHLHKGCYRGQETVARLHNLGRPPRRLALAHLDGSEGLLPSHGDQVEVGARVVGFVGSSARHHELGPIASVIVKRSLDPSADLLIRTADGVVAATQEVVISA
ncbi:MAG: YgfZ/GcvT domain-containing protein [Candidatus Nanopelagicales bacterium]